MIECYWCGRAMPEWDIDEHIFTAHPDKVSPMSPSHVEAIATHRGAYDLPMEES